MPSPRTDLSRSSGVATASPQHIVTAVAPADTGEDFGLFGPSSVTWRVHLEPVLWVAGLRALYLQALHPQVMRGTAQTRRCLTATGPGSDPSAPPTLWPSARSAPPRKSPAPDGGFAECTPACAATTPTAVCNSASTTLNSCCGCTAARLTSMSTSRLIVTSAPERTRRRARTCPSVDFDGLIERAERQRADLESDASGGHADGREALATATAARCGRRYGQRLTGQARRLWRGPGEASRQCDFVVYGAVLEHSGDPHFVRFEPEGQLSLRELVAHNFVAWTPLLHRRAGRDLPEHCDFQRSLAVGWINSECEVYRSVGVVLFDDVRFLGLSHFSP